ncbi:bifunctional nicotinamidase/pyrazinamidase [Commensalibacter oyaizuii]|uniref:nicotinamidase n=1 Tax=Commensalibacter oyaizuii TaxID=3043873 RepID=A0ABT6Q0T3_9PROT|nr:bifunctional nicotinamidase/pyrazinamidase [Commensalibacter sp. TBRC 16381]MDI2090356.1 bifunctional nicotinamidase/pyrazinamidase [Commensalibacter sp. TBRC 16381]
MTKLHINQQTDILAVIDVQNDFLPGGLLGVENGDQIIPVINNLLSSKFHRAFATQDWHPQDHISFKCNHPNHSNNKIILPYGKQRLWPTHAVQNTNGAALAPSLHQQYFQLIIRKGMHKNIDSYSAFYENDKKTSTGLMGWLQNLGITRIFLTGLAEDVCVAYSAKDAIKAGLKTFIISDATKPVASECEQTLNNDFRRDLVSFGATYLNSHQLLY